MMVGSLKAGTHDCKWEKKKDSKEAKQLCQAVVVSSVKPHLVSSCDENGCVTNMFGFISGTTAVIDIFFILGIKLNTL
ncbi:hypothetical protein A6R68_05227 [Neotoma lepida]|uniref:Uncharacterized protein n=1 Tax=Neotoma lepida TaxID=56216 RepID=A0A1A6GLL9_NEOLE|nr:hypothetical protein A6R68_05227 [Neotoma lepida]